MITATYDDAVKPAYSARMHQDVEFLTMREVPAGHWALWEAAGEVNALVKEWVEEVVFGEAKVLRPAVRTGAAKEEKKAKL
jgi:soluble epoxide hydrolase/lipid-phosphate phosphatase